MKVKKYFTLSNLSFMGAAILGTYVLISTYIEKSSLPAGACPLQSYDRWVYLAIGLAIVSVLTDGLGKRSQA